MINPFLIGIPTWLLSCLIAYVVRESSLCGLDAQQAGTLVLGLRPIRLRTTIAMVGVVALVLLIRFSSPNLAKSAWMAPCFPLVASVLVVAQIAAMKTLKRARLPPTFLRLYRIAQCFDFLGYGSLLATMTLATMGYNGHR